MVFYTALSRDPTILGTSRVRDGFAPKVSKIPPPSQNKAQVRLAYGLSGPCFGMGVPLEFQDC